MRIDLESDSGDPVLSLASLERGIVSANDDGGVYRNARIEQHLLPGLYLIEATTYLERDYQPLRADFTLTVHLVDETARQQEPKLKVEAVHTPAEVVAGDPFPVHYRVGNIGGGALPEDAGSALLYVVWEQERRRGFESAPQRLGHLGRRRRLPHRRRDRERVEHRQRRRDAVRGHPGPARPGVDVRRGAVTDDADGNEIGFHGLWHNLMVLSGPTFDPVDVRVGFSDYTVAAEADGEGVVTTTVESVADPAAEVDPQVRRQAVYTAGVATQLLDGVFERPAISELSEESDPERVKVANPLLEQPPQGVRAAVRGLDGRIRADGRLAGPRGDRSRGDRAALARRGRRRVLPLRGDCRQLAVAAGSRRGRTGAVVPERAHRPFPARLRREHRGARSRGRRHRRGSP